MMFIIVVDSFLEKSRDEIDKSVWFDYILYEVVILCCRARTQDMCRRLKLFFL